MPGHRACELPIHHNQLTHAEPPPELFVWVPLKELIGVRASRALHRRTVSSPRPRNSSSADLPPKQKHLN